MRLGRRAQFALGIPDLETSLDFYLRLGLNLIDRSADPYPWAQLTDGYNLILLNQDGMSYRGLIYFNPDLDTLVSTLEADGLTFFWKQPGEAGNLQSAMFIDPTGPDGPNGANNVGVNIVAHEPEELYQPPREPLTRCGVFGEWAVGVTDFEQSAAFWTKLGFSITFRSRDPYPWGILTDGLIVLGLHQYGADFQLPGDPAIPAFTYFAPDAADRIAALRQSGLEPSFALENAAGQTNNAGFTAPDGQRFFVFEGDLGR